MLCTSLQQLVYVFVEAAVNLVAVCFRAGSVLKPKLKARFTVKTTTLSVKELTTPSVKNNSFTLGVVRQYTLIETFVEVYRLHLSVFTH